MKTNLCSAGASYIHAYPNGDIYRCMKDYNTKMRPITNAVQVAGGQHLFDKPAPCSHRQCDVYCDADWSTKWLFDDNGVQRKVAANEWDGVTRKHPWNGMELAGAADPDFMAVIWTPTLPCNYTCSYCGCAAGNKKILQEFPSSTPELGVAQWLAFWETLADRYSWGYLQTNGGEPLLSDATIPVLDLMSKRWAINLVTNGSIKIMELVRHQMPVFTPQEDFGLSVTLSLHPTSKGFVWDTFLGKALMLKNEGYLRAVNFVGWSEQLYLFEYYRDQLAKFDIPLTLQPWAGTDNKGFSGYTKKELFFVKRHASSSRINNSLDLTGYRAKGEYESIISIGAIQVEGSTAILELSVENAGSLKWSDEDIKVGGRLMSSIFGNMKPIREFRAATPEAAPGEKHTVRMSLDLAGLVGNDFTLNLDMVFEQKFWFAERGSDAVAIVLKKTNGTYAVEASASE